MSTSVSTFRGSHFSHEHFAPTAKSDGHLEPYPTQNGHEKSQKKKKRSRPQSLLLPDLEKGQKVQHENGLALDPHFQLEQIFEGLGPKEQVEVLQSCLGRVKARDHLWTLLQSLEEVMKADPLTCLPPEINLLIFGYLDYKELSRAAQVSLQWKALAYDSTLLLRSLTPGNLYCGECHTFVGTEKDIVDRNLRLDYSLAFQFKCLVNVSVVFPSSDISSVKCQKCHSTLGVKYLKSHELEGTFVVKKKNLLSPGEPDPKVSLACQKCHSVVAQENDIIDWNFILKGNDAYLISRMFNIQLGDPMDAAFTSGQYSIAHMTCQTCQENLGVKYLSSPNAENAYKVGCYLVRKPQLEVKLIGDPKIPSGNIEEPRERRRNFSFGSFFSFFRGSN